MDSLAPPPSHNRHRASSTNVRPPLTLNSLGRRRSNSDLPPPCHTPSPLDSPSMHKELASLAIDIPKSSPAHKLLARATFVELYSRFMELLHVSQKESPYPSTPSSPRLSRSSTSTEDNLLPIVSPTVATFGEAYSSEKAPTKTASWWQGSPSVGSCSSCSAGLCVLTVLPLCRSIHPSSLLLPCSRSRLRFCYSACRPYLSPRHGPGILRTLRSSAVSFTDIP